MPRPRLDIADLVRRGRASAQAAAAAAGGAEEAGLPQRLRDLTGFGPNPGALRMRAFVPARLPPGAPLLVVLHGCTQTAAGFDRGCGWSDLAEQHGFALLAPEQRRQNNQNLCFNWFEPGDIARGQGEAESIRAAVAQMVAAHGLDPARVFVSGLSAGGAMATAMLATHPEVFAAGAIIAGLPYGAATSMQEAFEAMATGRPRPAATWAGLVRAAAAPRHGGPWPRVAIWQGEADTTVRPANATELVKQWTALHGLDTSAGGAGRLEGAAGGPLRRVWRDAAGRAVVELNLLPGLAHGVPIHPGEGAERGGRAMPYILDAGISAPHRILSFFGLGLPGAAAAAHAAGRSDEAPRRFPGVIAVGADGRARLSPGRETRGEDGPAPETPRPEAPHPEAATGGNDPGSVIRRALAAAGLLRHP